MILALDTETGGTDANRHAIVSLAVAVMDDHDVADSAEWIFQRMDNTEPKFKRRSYEVGALEISGTTWKQIKEGEPQGVVLQQLRKFIEANNASMMPVVSHNSVFDQSFVSDWLFRCGEFDRNANAYVPQRSPLGGPWICTRRMAECLVDLPNYQLDTVAAHLGFARSGSTHGAGEDCRIAGQVYYALLGQAAPE